MRTSFVVLGARFLLPLLTFHLSVSTADHRRRQMELHSEWTSRDDDASCGLQRQEEMMATCSFSLDSPHPVRNSTVEALKSRDKPHCLLEEESLSSGIGDIGGETVLVIVFVIGTIFIFCFIKYI